MKKVNGISFWMMIISCVIIGLIVGLDVNIANVSNTVEMINSRIQDVEIIAEGNSKQIPHIANFITIVKSFTEIAGDKMSAYEIVEVSKVIILQCNIHEDIGLTPDLIFGLIDRESSFNPSAISVASAYGLMQITRSVFSMHLPKLGYAEFSKELALNPVVNVQVGILELIRLRILYMEDGIQGWLVPLHSYFWGERHTRTLLTTKKRVNIPGLEYSQGVLNLAKQWKERGV